MRRLLLAPLLTLVLATPAFAQGVECRDLKDDGARLLCYDTFAPSPKSVKVAPAIAVPATPNARYAYAKQIERAFLSDGVDLSMMSLEAGSQATTILKTDPKHLPQLVFFGGFGRPLVYKMVAETPLLDVARKHGFRSIDFHSKFDGHWNYDLAAAGALPRCDRMSRICH